MQIKVVKKNGAYIASIPEAIGTPGVVYPLRMAPVAKVTYYEQRQGFNILSFLKTPYGMMIGFMVFSMVIMPYLKVDQEEYKQMVQERQRLTSAVTGGGGSSNSGGGGSRRDRRD